MIGDQDGFPHLFGSREAITPMLDSDLCSAGFVLFLVIG
jgi:hypothetical protein